MNKYLATLTNVKGKRKDIRYYIKSKSIMGARIQAYAELLKMKIKLRTPDNNFVGVGVRVQFLGTARE